MCVLCDSFSSAYQSNNTTIPRCNTPTTQHTCNTALSTPRIQSNITQLVQRHLGQRGTTTQPHSAKQSSSSHTHSKPHEHMHINPFSHMCGTARRCMDSNAHNQWYSVHRTQHMDCVILHASHCVQHIARNTLHTARYAQRLPHNTLYTMYGTPHMVCKPLHGTQRFALTLNTLHAARQHLPRHMQPNRM